MILAAIDIGSNAARLLISEVISRNNEPTHFNKLNLFRVPLRLGFDVFETQSIQQEKLKMFLETMQAFKHLMNSYQIENYIACATSAMRDAKNGKQILQLIKKETGINVEIISGDMEANMIYENHVAENMSKENSYIYIDVGGGSTELSVFTNNKLILKKSYNIGTIRLLKNQVSEEEWDEMKLDIKNIAKSNKKMIAIGTGGNINKVFTMSKRKDGKSMTLDLLRNYYKELSSVTVNERIELFQLRPDRADVIVPALLIYLNVMRWAGADEIYVPKIGLADGLIQHLWSDIQSKQKSTSKIKK